MSFGEIMLLRLKHGGLRSITHSGVTSGGTTMPSIPSMNTQVVSSPPFNPITEFFLKLKKNYQGVKTKIEESSGD